MRKGDDDWSGKAKYVLDLNGCWKGAACLILVAVAVIGGAVAAVAKLIG